MGGEHDVEQALRTVGGLLGQPADTRAVGTSMLPVSAARSPVIARNNVVLPVPLRPTRPTREPVGSVTEAFSMSRRPATRSERSLMRSMRAL
jgi:hypothetical protein